MFKLLRFLLWRWVVRWATYEYIRSQHFSQNEPSPVASDSNLSICDIYLPFGKELQKLRTCQKIEVSYKTGWRLNKQSLKFFWLVILSKHFPGLKHCCRSAVNQVFWWMSRVDYGGGRGKARAVTALSATRFIPTPTLKYFENTGQFVNRSPN